MTELPEGIRLPPRDLAGEQDALDRIFAGFVAEDHPDCTVTILRRGETGPLSRSQAR